MLWFANKKEQLTETQKFEWDFHNEHHRYLRWEKHTMEHQYSQLLVYLNSGIFIASSVIANMYEKIEYKYIIIVSWWLAALSLIFILLSFIFSIESFKQTIILWKQRKENLDSIYNKLMNLSTCISSLFLFIAIILTLLFFTLNFLKMSDNKTQTFVEKSPVGLQKNSEPVSAGISPAEFFAQTGTKIK